ncbi:DUF397 domain-containing protein [Embleya sp. NPDC005971]|uniref:DUF397 domain-containing protein n=1 Tax=Embleya sp. NPDC005971 TaxID=3156724 RepID=UPI0033CA2554
MTAMPDTAWFKSSYSNNSGGQCVEGAHFDHDTMAIRDSKDPSRGTFVFPAPTWEAFLGSLRQR